MKETTYDKENDILYFSKGRNIKFSIDIGDFILDIDSKGPVCGIEILDASLNLNISEKDLSRINKASMSVSYKPNNVYVAIVLVIGNKKKDIVIPLAADLGHHARTEKTSFAVA